MPRDARELLGFALLALMAGINEEFMFRGFAPDHLFRWGLPLWLAVAVVTLSFGLAHGYKSLAGMLRTMLIGLVLAVPVLVTGTLLPSIIAHALMDLLAGANTLPLARRLGVAIPEPGPAAVSAGPAAG
jgi:membrane protease YdiL (CAAX protease family)